MANKFLTLILVHAIIIAVAGAQNPGFVGTRGTEFVANGAPFLFNGFNSYWMMTVAAQPSERHKISDVFREAANAGLTVCRTWAFSDGGASNQALQFSPGVYNEAVFQGLDFVVSEARKYGVKLVLSFINNYKDYGGKAQYVEWAKSGGVSIGGEDDFYTNGVVRDYYKNHVKRVLTRINTFTKTAYKDDATIMAWELMNEPRCQADYSGKTVNGWVQEMASYVKSLDGKHLVTVGMEGFYGDSIPERKQYNPGYQVGTDFITNHQINEIDFTTIHAYPDVWLAGKDEQAQTEFVQRWLTSHWTDSKNILKKPLVFAEFGKSKKDPGYSEASRNAFLNTLYGDIYNAARDGGLGGGLVWQVMARGMDSYYDGYEIVLSQADPTTNLMSQQSKKMNSLEHSLFNRHRLGLSDFN